MPSTRKLRVTTRKTEATRTVRRKREPSVVRLLDDAMKRPATSVLVKPNPMQPVAALFTKIKSMEAAQKAMLLHVNQAMRERKLGPHAIMVHEDKCTFGVVIWPRAATPMDVDEMHDAVEERNEGCSCNYLVMYPGAQA